MLEYSWDSPTQNYPKQESNELHIKTEIGKECDTSSSSSKCSPVKVDNDHEQKICKSAVQGSPNEINTALQRLLSVAKLHYRKNMIKCPCGHVCGGPTKSTSASRTKSTTSKSSKSINSSTVVTPHKDVSFRNTLLV